MKKSPLALVKEKFGDKKQLVEAVKAFTTEELWVARVSAEKGLEHVSNAKLLRLHGVFSVVKEKFGSRAKLIDAIVELEKRTKDAGFRARLEKHPVPRLYDALKAAEKRAKAAAKAKAPPAPKNPAVAKPVAAKVVAKKPPVKKHPSK